MEVASKYGMIHPRASYTQEEALEKFEATGGSFYFMESTTETVRAVFIIDPRARIRAMIYYPLSNGRNMEEIKRYRCLWQCRLLTNIMCRLLKTGILVKMLSSQTLYHGIKQRNDFRREKTAQYVMTGFCV